MSDGETSESPKKEQVPMEDEEEEEEKQPVEDKLADVSTESKDEVSDTGEKDPEPTTDKETSDTAETPTKKTTIKKIPKKQKHEYIEDDEERLGLLERPVIIESGKREKRKVERLEMTGVITPNLQKKKVEVPEGTGVKLGDCPRIEHQLQKSRGEDLKVLHRILFGRVSTPGMVKKNIRQFCGFPFTKEDKEHEKKIATLVKLNMSVLKFICEVIDLERGGHKEDLVNRIMDFLLNPKSSGKGVPAPKKRRGSGKVDKKKGVKRKRTNSGKKGKTPEKKVAVEVSDSEADLSPDEEEEEGSEPDEKGDAPSKDEEEDEASEESEKEVAPPKKKKQKTEKTPKKEKIVKETKKEKPEKKVKEKVEKKVKEKPEKKVKEKVEKKEKKAASPKKQKITKAVEADDSSEDDEPLSKKQSSEPPSDEDVKECIKKILEGANLEEVTMKTVLKQVYETYPDFDLSDRKTFIKNTVKQLIS